MKRILTFIVAVTAGLVTWIYLTNFTEQPEPEKIVQETEELQTTQALVFSQGVSRGFILTEDVLQWENRIAETLPQDAITSNQDDPEFPSSIVGKVVTAEFYTGDLVRRGATTDGATGFMTLALNPGMVAIAVPVSTTSLAGGYILPEDRVDVIHTVLGSSDDDEPYNSSKTILRNVRVLAVGEYATSKDVFQTKEQSDVSRNSNRDQRVVSSTMTLELSEEQAQVLLSATQRGSINFALKAIEDYSITEIGDIEPLSDSSIASANMSDSIASGRYSISLIEAGVERFVTVDDPEREQEAANGE
jgi:pilus assembly protein CpaB